ncbi:MAG: Amidohydrolase, partial [Bacteroidetes bacterium]|nr:Amidohydrolase [Bacteroidota bacterium]
MKVTLIQSGLFWENRAKNISHFDELLNSITEETDLIILPEMFTTGFTMHPEKFSEPAEDATLEWLKQKAKQKKAVITGSVAVQENGKYFNRLYWADEHGKVSYYNKRHLFRIGKEDQHYEAGDHKIITQIKGWNICPLVCYDLRFPVWSRNKYKKISDTIVESEYDVLIYIANWPEIRNYPWKQLLIARAIENQSYVIGVNRIGTDGNGYNHSGDSVVINPKGNIISHIKPNEESIETVEIDKNYLEE